MNWRIGEAKQSFSKVVQAAREEPQLIYNRDRLVAAVVEGETFQEFMGWQRRHAQSSLAAGAAKVRQACAEEGYVFEIPERENRPNSFADALDDLPR